MKDMNSPSKLICEHHHFYICFALTSFDITFIMFVLFFLLYNQVKIQ